jgi:hypothetical protein
MSRRASDDSLEDFGERGRHRIDRWSHPWLVLGTVAQGSRPTMLLSRQRLLSSEPASERHRGGRARRRGPPGRSCVARHRDDRRPAVPRGQPVRRAHRAVQHGAQHPHRDRTGAGHRRRKSPPRHGWILLVPPPVGAQQQSATVRRRRSRRLQHRVPRGQRHPRGPSERARPRSTSVLRTRSSA